jgi:hypothetical protein
MTAGRDSRVRTTATFLSSICWLKLTMNVSFYPAAVSNTVSQFGESTLQQDQHHRVVFLTAATTPWWWTEGLKFEFFFCISIVLQRLRCFLFQIGETSMRTVLADKTLFTLKQD